jgi:glutamate-ammonia-ligase adenylyltransferase
VCSIQAYTRYHAETAATWERQALLRARPVAGSKQLAESYRRVRLEILCRPNPEGLAGEIHRVRTRMEEELALETSQRRNFKMGRGGVLDIESAVQYLQLLHGPQHPELLDATTLDIQRNNLQRSGLIDDESARVLQEGWVFLQELGSRLRIVENRSISSLDVEHGDLETLARQLDYDDTGGEGGARRALYSDYKAITERVRATYLDLLGIEAAVDGEVVNVDDDNKNPDEPG